jgi:histone H3/H4
MAESNNTSSPNVNVIASSASVPTHGQLPPSDEIQDLIMSTQTAPPTDGVFGTTTQTPTAPVTEHHTPVPMNVIVDQSLMGVQPSLGSIETAEDSQEGQSLDRSSLIAPGMSEAMMKLATFWHDQNAEINSMDPTHEGWRTPEMPLARVKKIMRMDEDIKMISAEVPVLFSKAASIFIKELTLRAWLQTEEAKRRTLQVSGLAFSTQDVFVSGPKLCDEVGLVSIYIRICARPQIFQGGTQISVCTSFIGYSQQVCFTGLLGMLFLCVLF